MDGYAKWPRQEVDGLDDEEEPDSIPGALKPAAFRQRSSLLPGAFLSQVAREVLSRLAESGGKPQSNSRGRLAKFWYGAHGSIHYEIWMHERTIDRKSVV